MYFAIHSESISTDLMQTKHVLKEYLDFPHQSLIKVAQLCNFFTSLLYKV